MKHFLILCITISGALNTFAQTEDIPQKKFGLRVGANYSLMNFNKGVPKPVNKVPNSWKPGVDIRLLLNLKISRSIALQPEYALLFVHGEDQLINTNYQLSYLSLPILIRMALTERIALLAGSQFDLLIHASQKLNGAKTDITHDTEERNISGLAGLEITLPAGVYFDARYINGFNHVGLNQRSTAREFKWQSVSAGIGVRF